MIRSVADGFRPPCVMTFLCGAVSDSVLRRNWRRAKLYEGRSAARVEDFSTVFSRPKGASPVRSSTAMIAGMRISCRSECRALRVEKRAGQKHFPGRMPERRGPPWTIPGDIRPARQSWRHEHAYVHGRPCFPGGRGNTEGRSPGPGSRASSKRHGNGVFGHGRPYPNIR